jgi:hypothetical protein
MTISTRALSAQGLRQRVARFQAEEEHKLFTMVENMASRVSATFGGDKQEIFNALASVVSRGEVYEVTEEDLPVAVFGLVVEPSRGLFVTMALNDSVSFKVFREPIEEIVDRAFRSGMRKLVAEASPMQAAFLKEAGFRVVGRLTGERLIDGRWEDTVLLERLANVAPPAQRTTVKQDLAQLETTVESKPSDFGYDEDDEDYDRPISKPKKRDTGLVDRQNLKKSQKNDLYAQLGLNPNEIGEDEDSIPQPAKPKVQRWDPLANQPSNSIVVR